MDSIKDFFRNWFGYSRRERRSTFILLNIIVIITGIRYVFPFHEISLKEIPFDLMENKVDSVWQPVNNKVAKEQKQVKTFYSKRKLLNINSCDSASLVALPGIGPVLSARIIKYRNLLGGYVSADQLKEVYGLPEETFIMISSKVFADSLSVRKIRINEADYKELIRHPYFKKNEVSAILKYRELKGKITDIGVMIENKLISPETGRKIKGYLDFAQE
jgi:DNA uptake protein ComE-like DNA-binding protein